MKKYAVLSMDIEDWYHLDYFREKHVNVSYSMLDGINNYISILESHDIKTTFFTLGEIADSQKHILRNIFENGHEIASHGWSHQRPLTMNLVDFIADIKKTKEKLEQIIGNEVVGYRAPCFSMNRDLLNEVKQSGFKYDSSKIDFSSHPLYGGIDIHDFKEIYKDIYLKENFIEFEVSTLPIFRNPVPVSGGGYLRIFPWMIMNTLIKKYLEKSNLFILYIHPFELSLSSNPELPSDIPWYVEKRFTFGRNTVKSKLNKLIKLLKQFNYEFTTFSDLHKDLINR